MMHRSQSTHAATPVAQPSVPSQLKSGDWGKFAPIEVTKQGQSILLRGEISPVTAGTALVTPGSPPTVEMASPRDVHKMIPMSKGNIKKLVRALDLYLSPAAHAKDQPAVPLALLINARAMLKSAAK